MWETDKRVEAILNSPIGCEFLSIAAAEGLSPDAIVAPRNALWLAAFATEEMTRWSPGHDANVEHALGQGERTAPLAHSVLQHPGSAWWFESLDLDHQVWIEHGKKPFDVEPLDGPLDTTTWQRPRTRGSGTHRSPVASNIHLHFMARMLHSSWAMTTVWGTSSPTFPSGVGTWRSHLVSGSMIFMDRRTGMTCASGIRPRGKRITDKTASGLCRTGGRRLGIGTEYT